MELFDNLLLGFQTALQWQNLLFCLLGVAIGTAVGVLPGIGTTATMAMLLPLTFQFEASTSLIMMAGIYYGAQYGGSTTAILINLPGESSSAVTAIDGNEMAKRGRAGIALATAAIGSFFAGTVATMVLAAAAPPLSKLAVQFGPVDTFSLVVLGLIVSIALARGSIIKALAMVFLGMAFSLVGTELVDYKSRFTFGIFELDAGISFVPVAIGLFGMAEVMRNMRNPENRDGTFHKVGTLWPSRNDFKRMAAPIGRGTVLGSALGILPGGGHILAPFASYAAEKKISRNKKEFGYGAIEGVAGPESANNAAAQTSFIPMLTLGLPANPVMALMLGAFIIQGITPGPNVINDEPDLVWGLIASMWIGNLLLVGLNLPLIGMWVKMLRVPYWVLFPTIMVLAAIGTYSQSNNYTQVLAIVVFGVLGYVLVQSGCEPAPMLLGFVLGPLLEDNFRTALLISGGDARTFVTEPISAVLLGVAVLILIAASLPALRNKRQDIFVEDD